MRYFLLTFLMVPVLYSCTNGQSEATLNLAPEQIEASFGEAPSPEGILTYDQFQSQLAQADQDSVQVKVVASVEEVCQMKGCWMNVKGETTAENPIMVRFKDYGFFVPKDIAGREVVIEGIAFRTTVSVEDQRHYAEDAGKSPEEIAAITEPSEGFAFEASGVLLIQ